MQRIVVSLGSVNAIVKNDLQLMCLKKSKAQASNGAIKLSVFNSKTRYFKTCKYDVRIASLAAMNI